MASPSACDYDWATNSLGLADYERDTTRYHSACPGIRRFPITQGPDNKYGDRTREICVGFSTSSFQLVLLFVEGRSTEFPVKITLSTPYMSYLNIEGEDPAGCYFGIYTRIGDWLDNELIAQGIIRPTGKTARDGWNTEFAVFELLLNKNEIIYFCDGGSEGCGSVGKVEDRFKQCSRCKMVRYCSQQCQAANWKYHKKECSLMLAPDIRQIERFRSQAEDEAHLAAGGEMHSGEFRPSRNASRGQVESWRWANFELALS